MRKISLGILIAVIGVILTVGVAFVLPTLSSARGINKAKERSPAITNEGLKTPPEFVAELPESELTKIVFIRHAPGFQKDKPCDYDGICDLDERGWCADCKGGEEEPATNCYDFLSGSKPKWNWIEDYYYSDSTLGNSSALSVTTWESATSGDIFGNGYSGIYDWGVYDYINSLSYGDYPEAGVIAVTAIWYRGKNIYEYDIMFDTDYFPREDIDLDTVVLHEFGHAGGLGDLYDTVCADNIMYGYYTGPKTTLGSGDIAGIQKLYGGL